MNRETPKSEGKTEKIDLSMLSNMNREVSEILKNRKNDADDCSVKKRRHRLTFEQQRILEAEFQKQPNWSRPGLLKKLSERLGLSKGKIYKWNWDRKKKELIGRTTSTHEPETEPLKFPFKVTQMKR